MRIVLAALIAATMAWPGGSGAARRTPSCQPDRMVPPAPTCERRSTGADVPCYSAEKVEDARCILERHGVIRSTGYVSSIEVTHGIFSSAGALADWIMYGD